MEPLKNAFGKEFYIKLAKEFKSLDKNFKSEQFVKQATIGEEERTLIQRMKNTSFVLQKHLPSEYPKALDLVLEVAPKFRSHFTSFLFPDFVGAFGHDHKKLSLAALKELTQYGTSEFAIREYLKRDLKGTLKEMHKWSQDKNHHIRRLASEGSRPRLPWSFNLDPIAKNPELTRPILENLRSDKELYVKKSVANHLNDFSRIDADWMLGVVSKWDNKNKDTAWIIRHASRSLIKQGHPGTLALFDFEKNVKVSVSPLKLNSASIKIGQELHFSFDISSKSRSSQKLVIDYAIHYAKSSGSAKKVFKLTELELKPSQKQCISKKQMFKQLSTRKHYSGKHKVEIFVNGKSFAEKEFKLVV
jgi:3-methyladenine DNA glycosylase AlkC